MPPELWNKQLVLYMMCPNSHVLGSTGNSPDKLIFGQVLQKPLDLADSVDPKFLSPRGGGFTDLGVDATSLVVTQVSLRYGRKH